MLKPGTHAPDVEIETHLGYRGPLSHFWRDGPLILFFYPKDNTTICTKQACSLQSSLGEFGSLGANVLGSSTGGVSSHEGFASKHGIAFPLVADEKGKLAKAFEAFRGLIRISKRITYLIDQKGVITASLHNELSVQAHMDMIRKALSEK